MLIKIAVIAVLAIIVLSLASALLFMLRKDDDPDRMARALTWRIGLSIGLFILLFIAYSLGLIAPHGAFPPP